MDSTPLYSSYQVRGSLPYARSFVAANEPSPQSVDLVWLPRVDGVFLVDDPQKLLQRGEVARIPFVSGDCDDEGTLFALSQTNVT
jgi:carboxylesterase type B